MKSFLPLFLLLSGLAGSALAQERSLSEQAQRSLESEGLKLPLSWPSDVSLFIQPQGLQQTAQNPWAPWPTLDWTTSTPQAQGMDPQVLKQALQYAQDQDSKGIVVIRNGYLVGEWYGQGWNKDTKERGYSIAKSFSSCLLGMLIEQGTLGSVNDSAALYVPEWRDSSHGLVTLRNLLSMDSGLHWDPISELAFLLAADQNAFAIGLSMDHPPCDEWLYHNAAVQVLSEVILNATGKQPHELARPYLWDKIGMWGAWWKTDQRGNTMTYQSVYASAREFAKFGYLYLRNGEWDGEQLLSESWVRESTRPSQYTNPFYGYLWWLNSGSLVMPDVPADAYMAAGANEKRIYVVPSLALIAVRLGNPSRSWDDNQFLGLICQSVL